MSANNNQSNNAGPTGGMPPSLGLLGMLSGNGAIPQNILGLGISGTPPITPTDSSMDKLKHGQVNSSASAASILGLRGLQIPLPMGMNFSGHHGQGNLSPGTRNNNVIPLPNLPATPSTPNGANPSSMPNFQYPPTDRKSHWVMMQGGDDTTGRAYPNPALNNFGMKEGTGGNPNLAHMQPHDDINPIMMSNHLMNDQAAANMRLPLMAANEFQPGTAENGFLAPEWPPRGVDLNLDSSKAPQMMNNPMMFDPKAGMISPPFSNFAASLFKMDNPYNSIDFTNILSYPQIDAHSQDRFPNDPFYPSYTMGLYEGAAMPDGSEYNPMKHLATHPLAMQAKNSVQASSSSGRKKKQVNKRKTSWTEDSGNNNSKRLRRNWSDDEEKKFLEALEMYGRDWHKCAAYVGTRDVVSCRSHAQKYFIKLWISGEPLPKKVADQGSGYTVSGKPLDPDSSFVKYYISLFEKRRQGVTKGGKSVDDDLV